MWRLNKLNQNPLSTQGVLGVSLRMNESHVVTACALSYATRGESHAALGEPFDALRKRVHPQSDVIQCGHVHPGSKKENERAPIMGITYVLFYRMKKNLCSFSTLEVSSAYVGTASDAQSHDPRFLSQAVHSTK